MTNQHTATNSEAAPPAEALTLYLEQIKQNNQHVSGSLKDLAQLIQSIMVLQHEQQNLILRQAARIKQLESQNTSPTTHH